MLVLNSSQSNFKEVGIVNQEKELVLMTLSMYLQKNFLTLQLSYAKGLLSIFGSFQGF